MGDSNESQPTVNMKNNNNNNTVSTYMLDGREYIFRKKNKLINKKKKKTVWNFLPESYIGAAPTILIAKWMALGCGITCDFINVCSRRMHEYQKFKNDGPHENYCDHNVIL